MKKFVLLAAILVSGCSYSIMSAHPLPAKNPLDVQVFFTTKSWPKCRYQELGVIMTDEMSTMYSAIDEVREKAAKMGADFVYVKRARYKSGMFTNPSYATGFAYTCSPVNRDRAPTRM